MALPDFVFQVLVGGGHDAHIHPVARAAPRGLISCSLLTANIINIVRVGFIPIIVLWAIYYYVIKPAAAESGTTQKLNVLQVIREKFPIFILGFFVMVTLNELGFFSQAQRDILGKDLLKIFFAIGFAGVGLNIAFAT